MQGTNKNLSRELWGRKVHRKESNKKRKEKESFYTTLRCLSSLKGNKKKHTEKKTTKKDCLEDFQTSIRGTYRKRKERRKNPE